MPTAFALGYVPTTFQSKGYYNPFLPIVAFGGSLFLCVYLWRKCFPNVRVVIQKDRVLVGNHLFDRQHFSGFRKGYEDNGPNDSGGNYFDKTFAMSTTLRFQYGRWGEDLEYMVNNYHASEYVIWMNAVIAEVGKPEPKEIDAKQGQRKQVF